MEEGKFGDWTAGIVLELPNRYLELARETLNADMDEAASLLCRAAMEAAMYTFLHVAPAPPSEDPINIRLLGPIRDGSKLVKIGWDKLVNRVGGKGVLSETDMIALYRIGEHGHTVAHVIERFHRHMANRHTSRAPRTDFNWPERHDIVQDIKAAESMITKFHRSIASSIQSAASSSIRGSDALSNP